MNKDIEVTAHARKVSSWSSFSSLDWTAGKTAVGNNGLVYGTTITVSSGTGFSAVYAWALRAYNRLGLMEWEVAITEPADSVEALPAVTAPAIAADGTIYIASTKRLFAFTPDGDLRWKTSTGGVKLALSEAKIYLADNANGPTVRSLDSSGAFGEELRLQTAEVRDLVLDSAGNFLVLASDSVTSYSPTFQARWSALLGTDFGARSIAVGAGRLFVPGTKSIVALGESNGSVEWSRPCDSTGGVTAGSDAIYANVLALGTDGSVVQALSVTTGALLWTGPTISSSERSLSTVVARDGSLFHQSAIFATPGSTGQSHLSLRHLSKEGQILWDGHFKQNIVGPNSISAPTLTPEGKLFFGFRLLYGLEVGVGPAETGWPMNAGDWRNQARPFLPAPPLVELKRLYIKVDGSNLVLSFKTANAGTFVLESSADLTTWTREKSFSEPEVVLDLPISNTTNRFYRITN